ncbi:hypothetical protein [Acinetobacter variabilis]|uniref:Uncharacterized protein n=1 Tax=Acinetobacter variabilis TaxID=70346 RepID=N8VI67_9GAMM|nr:hypothetical protein [Acinetobacter variabilis]ENU99626.1 hypothetical protein F969_01384 [Acinetobacter variabilis]
MRCRTIEHIVDAYEVEWLLGFAKDNWAALPAWFKKMHQENKILIGGSQIRVETESYLEDAGLGDVLFKNKDGFLEVLPKKKFYKLYQDILAG